MADIPARVGKLEETVAEQNQVLAEHHQVLFGPERCPDEGLVNQFSEIRDLVKSQTVYNKILTFFASAVAVAIITVVITYVMKMILK